MLVEVTSENCFLSFARQFKSVWCGVDYKQPFLQKPSILTVGFKYLPSAKTQLLGILTNKYYSFGYSTAFDRIQFCSVLNFSERFNFLF